MKIKKSHLEIAAILLFILISLVSFSSESTTDTGFYKKYFATVSATLAALIIISAKKIKIELRDIALLFAPIALGAYNLLITKGDPELSLTIASSGIIAFTFLLCSRGLSTELNKAIEVFLLLNVSALLLQAAYTLATGTGIYLHGIIFPFSRQTYALIEYGSIYRFSGYHLEPGSYANVMATAIALHLMTQKTNPTKITWISIFSLSTTFSAIGIIYCLLFSAILFKRATPDTSPQKNIKKQKALITVLAIFSLTSGAMWFGVTDYITQRFFSNPTTLDSSLSYKIANISSYRSIDFEFKILGIGADTPMPNCPDCGFLNSNGSLFYNIVSFGIAGLAISLLPLTKKNTGKTTLTLALIFMITRYSPIFIQYWVFFYSFFLISQKKVSHVQNLIPTTKRVL